MSKAAPALCIEPEERTNEECALMTEPEFLAVVKVSRAKMYQYRSAGLISFLKAGRRVFYDGQSVATFKANCLKRIAARKSA